MDTFKSNSLKMNNNSSNSSKKFNVLRIIYIILGILFLLLIIYVLVCYYNYYTANCYQKKNFTDYLFSTDGNICILYDKPIPKPAAKIKKDNTPKINNFLGKKEVFHISNQEYSYDQSKCKCESYGGRLATKNEITNAYNNGANWCSYGWTEGQNAYYPVQKCYYDSVMEEEDFLENSDKYCGKPGLNGGYFSNPQLKFGVNCYGVKPKGSVIREKTPYCAPKEFCKLSKNSSANQKLSTDQISPFNNEKWNY